MTKLKPDIKPNTTIHTLKDSNIAKARLIRLSCMIEVTHTTSNLDVVAIRNKLKIREVEV